MIARAHSRKTRPVNCLAAAVLGVALAAPVNAGAALTLHEADTYTLDNGLQVILLTEDALPVTSVQVTYRVGARNEQYGLTGLSHYLEHMAFRATRNFPDTEVVSKIYAVGGEWHAYTWIDQTVYYETLPAEHLDLALRIEADRMQHLLIPEDEVDPERGAVFTEMHSYENDPASLLRDQTIATAILAHPYRNNVVGLESDINNVTHKDLVALYRNHYHPGNAVLTVVGDFDAAKARARIAELFGGFAKTVKMPLPATREPMQDGMRRNYRQVDSDQQHFDIMYHAPAVGDADFVPFLLLREIIAGGNGLNFQHDLGFSPVLDGTKLAQLDMAMNSWFHATAQPFLFTIAGAVAANASQEAVESSIEGVVGSLRTEPVTEFSLALAKQRLLRELVFDIETTEDAAHQLGYFAALDALDVLMTIESRIQAVSANDVWKVAKKYLQPEQRTIGWATPSAIARAWLVEERPALEPGNVRFAEPQSAPKVTSTDSRVHVLTSGIPVIVDPVGLTDIARLAVVYPSSHISLDDGELDYSTLRGHTVQAFNVLPHELDDAIQRARSSFDRAGLVDTEARPPALDPWRRLQQGIDELTGYAESWPGSAIAPSAIVVVGNLDPDRVVSRIESAFGNVKPAGRLPEPPLAFRGEDLTLSTPLPRAQSQLAYVVPAPPPADPGFDAWRLALYVLSHSSEGRLGKKAIAQTGLLYWIDGEYATDASRAWVALTAGVDPGVMQHVEDTFRAELKRLVDEPPTAAEIAEARQHFLGRHASAAQSTTEIVDRHIRQWITRGELDTADSLAKRLAAVDETDVREILPQLVSGAFVRVRTATPFAK
jgi:zinc protease